MVTKKQRRRRNARAKWERQQQRRAQRARRRRRTTIVVGATLGVLAVLAAGFVITKLVTDDSSAGASTGAPAPWEATLVGPFPPGDRLPRSSHGVGLEAPASARGIVGSKAGVAASTDQPAVHRSSSRADRPDASVGIEKPRIVA